MRFFLGPKSRIRQEPSVHGCFSKVSKNSLSRGPCITSVPKKRIPSATVYYYCTWYYFSWNRRYPKTFEVCRLQAIWFHNKCIFSGTKNLAVQWNGNSKDVTFNRICAIGTRIPSQFLDLQDTTDLKHQNPTDISM